MAVYAIGDVQGCYDQLCRLLDRIDFDERRDTLWFCGDLVNRGPKSLKTLRFVHGLGKSARCVLGNHDLHLIGCAWSGRKSNGNDTLNAILRAGDRDELIEWLARQPFVHADEERRALLVHAGVPPYWSPRKLIRRAAKLKKHWRSELGDRLRAPAPTRWERGMDRAEKLHYTLGALTRMRFVDVKGRLNYVHKGGLESSRAGLHPWYDFLHAKWDRWRIYFGHWSTLGQTDRPNVIALDTGCVWGGRLTAVRVTRKPSGTLRTACIRCDKPGRRRSA